MSKKIIDLTEDTAPSSDDLVVTVNDPAGTAGGRKVTLTNLIKGLYHKTIHQDGGADELVVTGLSGLLADDQHVLDAEVLAVAAPLVHATRHQAGGADAIKLDDFATPDDNTDLNASTTTHGLLLKLDNTATHFLTGTGAWSNPKVNVQCGSFTRDTALATGTQAVTGVGFVPRGLITMTIQDGSGEIAWGQVGTDRAALGFGHQGSGVYTTAGSAFYDYHSSGNTYTGAINSWDADGFTVGWTKTGSPTGTITCYYMAFQ